MATLYIIDIDETLFCTDCRVRVKDGSNKEVASLDGPQFRRYKLQSGERFDFSDFDSSEIFARSARPVQRMVDRVKEYLDLTDGSFVIFLTSRADMDDRDAFLEVFRRNGIKIDRGHIERAGNLLNLESARRKSFIIERYLRRSNFDRAVMFDDDERYLQAFLGLSSTYPEVEMEAYAVNPNGTVDYFDSRGEA